MLRVALTGGIASGKSVVATRLAELGAVIIDADLIARAVVGPGTPGLSAVVERFGAGILTPGGQLDRAALGQIVFADPAARRDLESIVHPAVRARAVQLEAEAEPGAVVVQVVPLLVETGQQDGFDLVVVVDTEPAEQLQRLQVRDELDEPAAAARLAAQATREARLVAADVVLENTGELADLIAQVDRLWADKMSAVGPG